MLIIFGDKMIISENKGSSMYTFKLVKPLVNLISHNPGLKHEWTIQSPLPLQATRKILCYPCLPLYYSSKFNKTYLTNNLCTTEWCISRRLQGLFKKTCLEITIPRYSIEQNEKLVVYGVSRFFTLKLFFEFNESPTSETIITAKASCNGDEEICLSFTKDYVQAIQELLVDTPLFILRELFKIETPPVVVNKPSNGGIEVLDLLLSIESIIHVVKRASKFSALELRSGWDISDLIDLIKSEIEKSRTRVHVHLLIHLLIPGLVNLWILMDRNLHVIAWRGVIKGVEYPVTLGNSVFNILQSFKDKDVEVKLWITESKE